MADAYLLQLPDSARFTLPDGANACVVHANSADDAKAIAKAKYSGDSDAAWSAATATAIQAASDLEGFRLRVVIHDSDPVIEEEVTGGSGDAIDDLAAAMVTALNGNAAISGAAYNATTNTLTIAAGAGADDLGDKQVTVELLPPTTFDGADAAPIPDFVGAITDEGAATDDLTAVLGADSVTVPNFVQSLKLA